MQIGAVQELEVVRDAPPGFYLSDGVDDVLLPNSHIPRGLRVGDRIRVFVHKDSADRPVATVTRPRVLPGEFGLLKVVALTDLGAFFDWGLEKDLFCPFFEQAQPVEEGQWHLVRVYVDEATDRIACSTKVKKFLRSDGRELSPGQRIRILVSNLSRDAITVIIDNEVRGTLFPDEWHERLKVGDVRDAYVKSIQPDTYRIAVSLRPQGYHSVLNERDRILDALRKSGGSLPVSDKSSPEDIQRRFGLSKGSFKKLIGTLYREGEIEIGPTSIRLRR